MPEELRAQRGAQYAWKTELKRAPGAWDAIISAVLAKFPNYARVESRIANHPSHYMSYRAFLDTVATAIGSFEVFKRGARTESYDKLLHTAWPDIVLNTAGSAHDWQYYLVSEAIFEALVLTDPPLEWDLDGASKLPFDAVYFLLHDRCLSVDGDPVEAVGLTHIRRDSLPGLPVKFDDGEDVILAVAYLRGGGVLFSNQRVQRGEKFLAREHIEFRSLYNESTTGSKSEREVTQILIPLCLQLVTVMNNAGDLVTASLSRGMVGKAKKGTRKEKVEPAWIGRYFKLPRDPSAPASPAGNKSVEGGRSVRPHFRRGHWRGIRHGAGRKLLRQEWFPPCFVNADKYNPNTNTQ